MANDNMLGVKGHDRQLFKKLAETAHVDEHLRQLDILAERLDRNPLYGTVIADDQTLRDIEEQARRDR